MPALQAELSPSATPLMAAMLPFAAVAAACLAGAELAQLVLGRGAPAMLPPIWAPTGILLAALLLSDRRRWTALLITGGMMMLASLAVLHGHPVVPSLGISLLASLDALLTAWLVRRLTADGFSLERLQHACALVACAAAVPLASGVLADRLVLPVDTAIAEGPAWRAWWLAEGIGMLIAAPLAMIAAGARAAGTAPLRLWGALELAVALALGLAFAEAVFGGRLEPATRVPALVLPFILWPAFRFGPRGAVAPFAIGILVLWHAARGEGPTTLISSEGVLLRAQAGVLVTSATLLLLSSVVAERGRAAQERAALVAELQQALVEIRTLRGFLPICAWCHKVRDDAGFWQEIENYLDAHTDATVSHSICPGCIEREHRAIAAHEKVAANGPPSIT